MPAAAPTQEEYRDRRIDTAFLLLLAGSFLLLHVAAGGRYGFQRDELATLEDARPLAAGYVAYPPLTPFFGRISLCRRLRWSWPDFWNDFRYYG